LCTACSRRPRRWTWGGSSPGKPKAEKRQEAVAETVRQIKVVAGDSGVAVLLLAQLNRGSEMRADKRPVLSDLRESGEVEQSADVVMLLHRPDMYDRDTRPGEADVIVAKQRNGPVGTAPIAFRGHYSRLDSMTGWDA
jgi:replicative DNA helicase